MVPLLLGVTKEAILRLEYDTKEVQSTFLLVDIKRYAASNTVFGIDMGPDKKNFHVETSEGEKIKAIVDSYMEKIKTGKKIFSSPCVFNSIFIDAKKAALVPNEVLSKSEALSAPQKAVLVKISNGQKKLKASRAKLFKKSEKQQLKRYILVQGYRRIYF